MISTRKDKISLTEYWTMFLQALENLRTQVRSKRKKMDRDFLEAFLICHAVAEKGMKLEKTWFEWIPWHYWMKKKLETLGGYGLPGVGAATLSEDMLTLVELFYHHTNLLALGYVHSTHSGLQVLLIKEQQIAAMNVVVLHELLLARKCQPKANDMLTIYGLSQDSHGESMRIDEVSEKLKEAVEDDLPVGPSLEVINDGWVVVSDIEENNQPDWIQDIKELLCEFLVKNIRELQQDKLEATQPSSLMPEQSDVEVHCSSIQNQFLEKYDQIFVHQEQQHDLSEHGAEENRKAIIELLPRIKAIFECLATLGESEFDGAQEKSAKTLKDNIELLHGELDEFTKRFDCRAMKDVLALQIAIGCLMPRVDPSSVGYDEGVSTIETTEQHILYFQEGMRQRTTPAPFSSQGNTILWEPKGNYILGEGAGASGSSRVTYPHCLMGHDIGLLAFP